MSDVTPALDPMPIAPYLTGLDRLPDAFARDVIAHLCGEACRGMGETVEWCEGRNDCYLVVTCGGCRTTFTLDEAQYEALIEWSEAHGNALACGITKLPG